MERIKLPGKGNGLAAVIGNALAWGFKTSENNRVSEHTVPGPISLIWKIGIDLLDSRFARRSIKSLVSMYLACKPEMRTSNNRKKNQLIRYFNSLDAGRKTVLVCKLLCDHLVRSLRRHRLSVESASGNSFSYLTAVALSIGGRCNLSCTSCIMKPFQSPRYAGIHQLDYIFDQADNLGVSYISIMGAGEPFLDMDYSMELLNCMEKHERIYFFVYTNGTTISEELVRKAAELDNLFILVSVEGSRESHEKRRGRGTYEKAMNTFQLLKRYHVPYGYSAVVHYDNYREVTSPDFVEEMAQAGALIGCYNQSCNIFSPGTGDFTGESKERDEYYVIMKKVSESSPIYIVDLFNIEEERYGCRAKKGTSCFIDAVSGKVSPCFLFPFSAEDSNIYEHRSDSRLEEILRGEFYNHYREEYCKRRLCIRDVKAELSHFCNNPWLSRSDRTRVENLMEAIQ